MSVKAEYLCKSDVHKQEGHVHSAYADLPGPE